MSEEKSARDVVKMLRGDLTAAGERRKDAAADEQLAMDEITELVKQGEGVLSVAEMARLSGVSRDTIYTILKSKN